MEPAVASIDFRASVMNGTHEAPLVVLSVLIAICASYTALTLAGRVSVARGRVRLTNVASHGGDAALASTHVGLASTLKLRTVAEGVEDAAQREQLIALGCGYGQGYLFAKPVGADVLDALLRDGAAVRATAASS